MNIQVSVPAEKTSQNPFISLNSQNGIHATIGKGSYIVEATIETMDCTRSHILIGNYCSIAHRIKFFSGLNHPSNGITTYPFDVLEADDRLAIYRGSQYTAANHYQTCARISGRFKRNGRRYSKFNCGVHKQNVSIIKGCGICGNL